MQTQQWVLTWARACRVESLGFKHRNTSSVDFKVFSLRRRTNEDCCCWRILNRSLMRRVNKKVSIFKNKKSRLLVILLIYKWLSTTIRVIKVPCPDERSASFEPDSVLIKLCCILLFITFCSFSPP